MMFEAPRLKVVLATIHIPLMDVRNHLTIGQVFDPIDLGHQACVALGIESPHRRMCGLNPHAGEGGLLGDEETRVIQPAIDMANRAGINASGPWPADTIFSDAVRGNYDLVVAMYHDQGLIPLKLMEQGKSSNWTIGPPIIRTSPGSRDSVRHRRQKSCRRDLDAVRPSAGHSTGDSLQSTGFATRWQWTENLDRSRTDSGRTPPSVPSGATIAVMTASNNISMEELVSLCKRRDSSSPRLKSMVDSRVLGLRTARNRTQEQHPRCMVAGHGAMSTDGPDGEPVSIVGLDSSIIQNPRVWEASGHVGGFNDPMVDCRETKSRYRADHLLCLGDKGDSQGQIYAFVENDEESLASAEEAREVHQLQARGRGGGRPSIHVALLEEIAATVGPGVKTAGTLTEPRQFNLMFKTFVGVAGRRRRGLSATGNGPRHIPELQQCSRHHACQGAFRNCPGRQGLPK